MTRINAAIHPSELPTKLLVAERRELIRIPNAVKNGKAKSKPPEKFKLGTGHVCWFYNRLGYLKKRYIALTEECVKRGIKATDYLDSFDGVELNDWEPTLEDRQIIVDRIRERGFELLKVK